MASFHLRSSTIRLGIFISTILIAVILIFQLAWLNKVYKLEQKEFHHSVIKSVRGLYEDLNVSSFNTSHLNSLIENPASGLYLAKIDLPVNKDSVVEYLQSELEDFDVFTLCRAGLYSSSENRYITTVDIFFKSVKEKENAKKILPTLKRNYDYLALYFPNRNQYILSQMNVWIISTGIMLVVLILFSGGLFYFYRQKFINEIQKDFTNSFTHEFKTPVSVISLAADVLSDEAILNKPAKLATYAGIVKYQANYLQSQIEKLLQFANSDSKRLRLNKEAVNLHNIISEASENLAPLISQKNVQLHFRLDAVNFILNADRNYLLIVIMNLLDNAIKYSKEPHISIVTRNEGRNILFSITDNGVGIDKKEQKKIFQKFYRSREGEVYNTKGFGLGLTFVKMILDAHKGQIEIESIPGLGSTFHVSLPLK